MMLLRLACRWSSVTACCIHERLAVLEARKVTMLGGTTGFMVLGALGLSCTLR